MTPHEVRRLLEEVRDGSVSVGAAMERIASLPFEDLGFARIDHHRAVRTGFPEVVFAPNKKLADIAAIVTRLYESTDAPIMTTRAGPEVHETVLTAVPDCTYYADARIVVAGPDRVRQKANYDSCYVAVVCAGTADIPVAEEAAVTLTYLGDRVERLYDVGVAGLHRLLSSLSLVRAARAVIVVAGMEGALPSVVAGLVSAPVIAVPTSVGYGAAFGGLAALLTMLNTCATGVAVVNIDNGFGAAAFASLINQDGDR